MNLLRILLLLQFTALAIGQAPSKSDPTTLPNQPEALVRSLYTEVLARNPLGISVGGKMEAFVHYLSKALLRRIEINTACQDDWKRQNSNPNLKPPFVEFGLFSGDDERAEPQTFQIERVQAQGDDSFLVYVTLTWEEPPAKETWRVAAVVVLDNGRYVVDDVIYLKDSRHEVDLRLSDYLSRGCDGTHWVGGDDTAGTQPRN